MTQGDRVCHGQEEKKQQKLKKKGRGKKKPSLDALPSPAKNQTGTALPGEGTPGQEKKKNVHNPKLKTRDPWGGGRTGNFYEKTRTKHIPERYKGTVRTNSRGGKSSKKNKGAPCKKSKKHGSQPKKLRIRGEKKGGLEKLW